MKDISITDYTEDHESALSMSLVNQVANKKIISISDKIKQKEKEKTDRILKKFCDHADSLDW